MNCVLFIHMSGESVEVQDRLCLIMADLRWRVGSRSYAAIVARGKIKVLAAATAADCDSSEKLFRMWKVVFLV